MTQQRSWMQQLTCRSQNKVIASERCAGLWVVLPTVEAGMVLGFAKDFTGANLQVSKNKRTCQVLLVRVDATESFEIK